MAESLVKKATIAQVRAGKGGRMVEIDDDVFDLAKRLHEIDTSLGLDWNDVSGYFRVYQQRADGTKHMVTTSRELNPALIEEVREICSPHYDLAAGLDEVDDRLKREGEDKVHEQIGEMGEHLQHALRKDLGAKSRIYLPSSVTRNE